MTKFARQLAALPIPSPKRQNAALQALAITQGRSIPKGFDLAALLPLVLKLAGDNPELLKFLPTILKLLPSLIAIWAAATGGAAGAPGQLPGDTEDTRDEDDIEEPPTPPDTGRTFAGLTGKYTNFQRGPAGKVHADEARGKQVFDNGANIDAANEKSKYIGSLTPIMSDGKRLAPGDQENADIHVDYYGIVYDGELFKGDEIKQTPIVVSNPQSSNGMNPRIVVEDIQGAHTVAFEASVNGFVWRGKTLFINRH